MTANYQTWNYRVIKHVDHHGRVSLCIHEVFYDGDHAKAITKVWCAPAAESVEDLKEQMELMKLALDRPVLNYSDFP